MFTVKAYENDVMISEVTVEGHGESDVIEFLNDLGEFNDYKLDDATLTKISRCKRFVTLNKYLPENIRYELKRG